MASTCYWLQLRNVLMARILRSEPMVETMKQNITIEADFSGVRNADEIEKAFANIQNMASQYANRTR